MAHVDRAVQVVEREAGRAARVGGVQHGLQVDERLTRLRQHVAVVHRVLADDAGRARHEQRHPAAAGIGQRRTRERRRPRPVGAGVAVGRHLARVLQRPRRRAGSQEAQVQPAAWHVARVGQAQGAGRRRAFEGVVPGFHERLLAADVELAVALHAAAVAVDARQVVPQPQHMRVAARAQRREDVEIGLPRHAAQVAFDIGQVELTEGPAVVGLPLHRAAAAVAQRAALAQPGVDLGPAGRQHRQFQARQARGCEAPAQPAQRRRVRGSLQCPGGRVQAHAVQAGSDGEGGRVRRSGECHGAGAITFSPCTAPTSRINCCRSRHARQLRGSENNDPM